MTCRAAREERPCPEFRCCECGRHVIQIVGAVPEPRLCASCLMIPGWLAIPNLRAIIDPDGDAREPVYTALPTWSPR